MKYVCLGFAYLEAWELNSCGVGCFRRLEFARLASVFVA
jgi:hypothetical protein